MRTVFSARARRVLSVLGASRHSLLPTVRTGIEEVTRPLVIRTGALLAGSTMIGVAVALLVEAHLGLPPYDVLSSGIADRMGLTLGQAGWAVAGVLFAIAALLGHRPSLWGVAYILANGLAVDATTGLLNTPTSLAVRFAFLVAAVVTMAVAINLVLFSGTTGGPFELLMAAGEERGVSRVAVRYVLDVGVLVLGLALGGVFGVGTLIYAALMGAVMQTIAEMFADYRAGRALRRATHPEFVLDSVGLRSLVDR